MLLYIGIYLIWVRIHQHSQEHSISFESNTTPDLYSGFVLLSNVFNTEKVLKTILRLFLRMVDNYGP